MKPELYCPRCGSDRLTRLAKNEISPFRGYRCDACTRRLSDPGSRFVYVVVLLVGLFLATTMLASLDHPDIRQKILQAILILSVSLICVVYAVVEISRPIPRKDRPLQQGQTADWFYAKQGVKVGPFTYDQIKQMLDTCTLEANDMVFNTQFGKWESAGCITGVAQHSLPDQQSQSKPPKRHIAVGLIVASIIIIGFVIIAWRVRQPDVKSDQGKTLELIPIEFRQYHENGKFVPTGNATLDYWILINLCIYGANHMPQNDLGLPIMLNSLAGSIRKKSVVGVDAEVVQWASGVIWVLETKARLTMLLNDPATLRLSGEKAAAGLPTPLDEIDKSSAEWVLERDRLLQEGKKLQEDLSRRHGRKFPSPQL